MQYMPGMTILVSSTQSVYDNQNRLTSYTMNMINPETFTLTPFLRLSVGYANNNVASLAGWAMDDEIPYWRTEFQHDNQGRVVLETEHTSTDSSNWVLSYRTETSYHPNDTSNAASNIEFMATFYPATFGESLRSFPGMPQQFLSYDWNGVDWVLSERETLSWDGSNNHLLNILDEEKIGENWTPYYKEVYTYDTHHNISQVIMSDYANNAWTETQKEELTWFSYGSANEDFNSPVVANLQLSIYPSPFADMLNIQAQSDKAGLVKVNIYNLKGQQVRQLTTTPGNKISWDGRDMRGATCADGIYLLKAEQNGNTRCARIMKLK